MKSELTQLVSSSGLEQTKQNQIAQTLGMFFDKASEWDATIKSIVITNPDEIGKMKMAREGRLTLRRMRLDAEKIVKDKRATVKMAMADFTLEDKLWLKAGQMMEATFENLESKLAEKENFAVQWELQRKEERTAARLLELSDVSENDQFVERAIVEDMADDIFNGYLLTVKKMKEEKVAAALIAEADRIAKENAVAAENARLKVEAEAREKEMAAERAAAEKAKAAADAERTAAREANDKLQMELQRAKAERQAEADFQVALARVEAERIEAQRQAEAKAAQAPRLEKLTAWIGDLKIPVPPGMDTDPAVVEVLVKFAAFKVWAVKQFNIARETT